MGWIILAFIVYWLILFVGCYVVVDYSQKYLYDESTSSFGLKLTGGTFLLALLMTILRKQTTYDTMFTSYIHWTVLQAIVWFGVFTLIFRFQPLHGLTLGVACFILMAGMSSLAVDSLTGEVPPEARIELHPPAKPPRRPASPNPMPPPAGTQPAAEKPESKDEPKP